MIPYRGSAEHFNRTVFSRRLPPQADYYSVKKAIRHYCPVISRIIVGKALHVPA